MKRAKHIKMTEREFKKLKRKQFKAALKAVAPLAACCAYLPDPAFKYVSQAQSLLEVAQAECRPWWRKA